MKTITKLLLIFVSLCITCPELKAVDPEKTQVITDIIGIFGGGGKTKNKGQKESSRTSLPKGNNKIVSQHPDFKITLKRCQASGNTCIIDLIMENIGDADVKISSADVFSTTAYDDSANQYQMNGEPDKCTLYYGIGDTSNTWWQYNNINLMREVPVKARIRLERVPEDANKIVRLVWPLWCEQWGLSTDKPVTFYNLEINREDNE